MPLEVGVDLGRQVMFHEIGQEADELAATASRIRHNSKTVSEINAQLHNGQRPSDSQRPIPKNARLPIRKKNSQLPRIGSWELGVAWQLPVASLGVARRRSSAALEIVPDPDRELGL